MRDLEDARRAAGRRRAGPATRRRRAAGTSTLPGVPARRAPRRSAMKPSSRGSGPTTRTTAPRPGARARRGRRRRASRARAPRSARRAGSCSYPGAPVSRAGRPSSDLRIAAARPSWSSSSCERNNASSEVMPRRRNRRSTRASGGPVSTSTRRPGASISAASPWPTSRNVTRRARGGAGEARADGHADASTSPASPPAMATDGRRRTIQASAPPSRAPSSARPGTAPSSQAPQRATRPTYAPRARMAASSATVAPGATGHTAQAARASQSSGATAGSASRFAGRLATSDVRPKCTSATGAVARVQASETASGLHNRNGTGVPSSQLRMARRDAVDCRDRGERELESGPRDRPRIEREHRGRREGEQMPGIASRADQPGQRHEHARRCGAHDRRPASDDRRVGDDGGDRASVCERSRHAARPRPVRAPRRPAARRCRPRPPADARARTRGTPRACRRPASRCHPARRRSRCGIDSSSPPRRERGARAAAQAIEHALDAAAPPEHGDRAGGQRLVHALAREPGAPVEAAAGRRHRSERAADLRGSRPAAAFRRAQLDGMTVELAIAELPNGPGRGWPSITIRAPSTCPTSARRGSAARAASPCADQAAPPIAQARPTTAIGDGAARRALAAARAAPARTSARPSAPDSASAGSARPTASHGAASTPSSSMPRGASQRELERAAPRGAPARCR